MKFHSIRQAASQLGIKHSEARDLLYRIGFIHRDSAGNWRATRQYQAAEYLTERYTSVTTGIGSQQHIQIVLSDKGIAILRKHIERQGLKGHAA